MPNSAKENEIERKISKVLAQNIEAITNFRLRQHNQRGSQERLADAVTAVAGSMGFFYFHVVWFAVWLAANTKILPIKAFDPFPFGLLTTIVSLEAIGLSVFVLISQNRQAKLAEQRTELDLQINLLAEYEVTRMLRMIDKIAKKLEITDEHDREVVELCEPVAPELVLGHIAKKLEEVEQL